MMKQRVATLISMLRAGRVASVVLALWLSAVQTASIAGSFPVVGQVDDADANASQKDHDHKEHTSQLSDKEVLKLQAEKRDSIDRLEKTAAEIARQWHARQARNQSQEGPSDGGQSRKSDPNPNGQVGGFSESGGTTNTVESSSGDQSSQVSLPPNPLESSDPSSDADSQPAMNPGGVGDGAVPEDSAVSTGSESGMDSLNESAGDAEGQADPSVSMAPVSSVVDGPIDRLALATSLYATDQLRECLKILEAVELRPLSIEDRQWHDYLAASAYRKLGNLSEAESLYRSVLQRSSSTWVSKAARWWLDHVEEKAQLELKLEQVQTTIGNWRKEIDVLKSAN